jgi:hypothetical protein
MSATWSSLIPLDTVNKITMTPPNTAPTSLEWRPNNLPAGYPPHCCVFAFLEIPCVQVNALQPTSRTFANIASHVLVKNTIAQRNLNIQGCAVPNSQPLWTVFPWIQIANPFLAAAAARIEIDARDAPGQEALEFELAGKIWGVLTPGKVITVALEHALEPGEYEVMRVKASAPVGSKLGSEFSIHLSFYLEDTLVTGYTHTLRVVPLAEAVNQVLDKLVGALRDVAAAYDSPRAAELSLQVNRIREEEQQSRGCLIGILQMFIKPRRTWISRLSRLARDIEATAQQIQSTAPEAAWRGTAPLIHKLGEDLHGAQELPPEVFLERLRESADRLQEPAGRLARHKV